MEKELITLFGTDYLAELARRSTSLSYNQFYYVMKQGKTDKGNRVIKEVRKIVDARKKELQKIIL